MSDAEIKTLNARVDHLEEIGGSEAQPLGYDIIKVKYTDHGEYVYFADFVVSFGSRVAKDDLNVYVNRMWANDILIYDRDAATAKPVTPVPFGYATARTVTSVGGNETSGGEAVASPLFTFFQGDEDQGPVYRGMHYRGLMVARFINFDLTDYDNSIPAITVELLDGDAFNPANTTWATLFGARWSLIGQTTELHAGYDTLWRSYGLFGSGAYSYYTEKVRLSTKVSALAATPRNGGLNGVGNIGSISNYMPALNMFLGQPNDNPTTKYLYDASSGNLIASAAGVSAWQGSVAFKVNDGPYTEHLVIGACSTLDGGDYPVTVVRVKDNILSVFADGTSVGPVKTVVRGQERDGVSDIYLITAAAVERLTFSRAGLADYDPTYYVPAGGNTLVHGWFDAARVQLLVAEEIDSGAHTGVVRALDAAGAVVWSTIGLVMPNPKPLKYQTQEATSDLSAGSLVMANGVELSSVHYIDTITGYTAVITVPVNGVVMADYPSLWDSRSQTIYGSFGVGGIRYTQIGVFPAPADDPDRYTAAEVVRAYAQFVGYDDADIFTLNMDDMFIDGYVVSNMASLAGISTALGQLYGFNWTERTGDIVYKANHDEGELVVDATTPFERLAFLGDSDTDQQYINIVRRSDLGLPASLSLSYFDGEHDYKPGYQLAKRGLAPVATMDSQNPMDWSLPITLEGDYALQLIYAALFRMWATKVNYSLRLPAEAIILDAGDVLQFTANGFTYQAVISRHIVNGDFSVSLDLVDAATSDFPVAVTTQPLVSISPRGAQPVRTVVLDIPSTDESQNDSTVLNLLVLMAGYAPGKFRGGVFEMGDSMVVTSTGQEAYIGTLIETLEPWPYPFELDTYNNLYFDLGTIPADMLMAATSLELDNEPLRNLLVIGEGSDTELVQFMDVEDIGEGQYRVYNLRRGRFGTEVFMGVIAGSPVSFLNNAQLVQYTYDDYYAGTQQTYRGYAPNQPKWQIDDRTITPDAHSRKPYAPINIEVARNDDGDLIFTFVRRARFLNSPPTDFINDIIPSDEDSELYELHIPNTTGNVRVWQTSTTTFSYSLTEQINDGYVGDETAIAASVYQSSPETIGIGFTEPGTFPVYAEGTQRMRARMSLGGSFDADATTNPPTEQDLSGTMSLGGDMTTALLVDMSLSATMVLGGEMTTDIPELGTFNGILVYPSSDGTPTIATTAQPVSLNNVLYNEGGWTQTGSNDGVIVPSGVTMVDIMASVNLSNVGTGFGIGIQIRLNGADLSTPAWRNQNGSGYSSNGLSMVLKGVVVAPGDEIDLIWFKSVSTSMGVYVSGAAGKTFLSVNKSGD